MIREAKTAADIMRTLIFYENVYLKYNSHGFRRGIKRLDFGKLDIGERVLRRWDIEVQTFYGVSGGQMSMGIEKTRG